MNLQDFCSYFRSVSICRAAGVQLHQKGKTNAFEARVPCPLKNSFFAPRSSSSSFLPHSLSAFSLQLSSKCPNVEFSLFQASQRGKEEHLQIESARICLLILRTLPNGMLKYVTSSALTFESPLRVSVDLMEKEYLCVPVIFRVFPDSARHVKTKKKGELDNERLVLAVHSSRHLEVGIVSVSSHVAAMGLILRGNQLGETSMSTDGLVIYKVHLKGELLFSARNGLFVCALCVCVYMRVWFCLAGLTKKFLIAT